MNTATRVYLTVNIVGLCLFLLADFSIVQDIKAEHRDYPDFGDSLTFLVTGVPVFLLCFGYSVIFGVTSFLKRNYRGLIATLAVVAIWSGLILILRMVQ